MQTETSKKQYRAVDPISRFRWALSFQGISPAAGKVLAALADHADQRKLTCWPAVETLARETQTSRRTVQTALRQLEAAGAILTERSKGRTSSVYRLLIAPNRADSAPFNRAVLAPNRAIPARFNRAESAPQQSYSLEQSKRTLKQQQRVRVREPDENQPDAAAAESLINGTAPADKRHVCPECENTWPKHFGAVCFKCQCNVEHAKRRAKRDEISDKIDAFADLLEVEVKRPTATAVELRGRVGGHLPESWLHDHGLKHLVAERNFKQLCTIIIGIGPHQLPQPKTFFDAYEHHLQTHNQGEAELNAMAAA